MIGLRKSLLAKIYEIKMEVIEVVVSKRVN